MGLGSSWGTHPELSQQHSPQVHPDSGIAEGRTAENGLLFTFWEVLQQKAPGLS